MPKLGDHPTKETRAKMSQAAHVRQAIKKVRADNQRTQSGDKADNKRMKPSRRKVVKIEPGAWWRQTIVTLECGHFKVYTGPAPKTARCFACMGRTT